jgi:pilus assembly protein CpaE
MPDLVVLDLMMPQMDGLEVCRRIKADPRTAHLPVVMLTAKSQSADEIEGFRAGADDYIEKPVTPNDLIRRLQTVLERAAGMPEEKLGRVVSVLGARGGVGATTLAVNLALALASGARAILADFEPGGMAAIHLGLEPLLGLNSLVAREAESIDRPSVEDALAPHPGGLRLLAAADASLDPAQADAVLNHLLAMSDVCVIDLGAGLTPTALAVARQSNDFILALDADRLVMAQAKRVVGGLNEGGLPIGALKLVWVNRIGLPVDATRPAIQAALGQDLAAVIGPASEALYQALEQAQPLVVGLPEHPVAVQFRALASSLAVNA